MEVGVGVEVSMGVGCPCPPVRDDVVNPASIVSFGQRPQRGQSPIEHRGTFVCPSVRLSVHSSVHLFVPPIRLLRPLIRPLKP